MTFKSLKEIASILNFSEDEVMELTRQRRIPFLKFSDERGYQFVEKEVLAVLTPRPKKAEEGIVLGDIPTPIKEEKPVASVKRGKVKK